MCRQRDVIERADGCNARERAALKREFYRVKRGGERERDSLGFRVDVSLCEDSDAFWSVSWLGSKFWVRYVRGLFNFCLLA